MALLCLEPQGEEAGTLRSASGCDNCPLGLPGNPLPEHPGAGCDPEVPEHERPGRELRRCGSGTLSSVGGTAEQSGAALLPGPTAVVGERGDQTAGHEDQARAANRQPRRWRNASGQSATATGRLASDSWHWLRRVRGGSVWRWVRGDPAYPPSESEPSCSASAQPLQLLCTPVFRLFSGAESSLLSQIPVMDGSRLVCYS